MNYYDSFIQIAPDSTATCASIPPNRGETKSIPLLEYELLSQKPYFYTQEELLFAVHLARQGTSSKQAKTKRKQLWDEFFSKPKACLRTSSLPKRYGWGFHFDQEGKIALVAVDSPTYQKLSRSKDLTVLAAVRSKRA